MKTLTELSILNSDVRIDPQLNKHLFSKGVRSVPNRVRLRLTKKSYKDEDAGLGPTDVEKSYVLVQLVQVESFKGMKNERVLVE